jgi:uncharacterized membrane protein
MAYSLRQYAIFVGLVIIGPCPVGFGCVRLITDG